MFWQRYSTYFSPIAIAGCACFCCSALPHSFPPPPPLRAIPQDLCLLALDAKTGVLRSSQFTNFTVYKYSAPTSPSSANSSVAADNTLLAFVEGFDSQCGAPNSDAHFAFATVDLTAATATLRACVSSTVTIDEEEWDSSFSTDYSMMDTGSGDAEAGGEWRRFSSV